MINFKIQEMKKLIILATSLAFLIGCTPSIYYGSYKAYDCSEAPFQEWVLAKSQCLKSTAMMHKDKAKAFEYLDECQRGVKAKFCQYTNLFYAKEGFMNGDMYDCSEAYSEKARGACRNVGFDYGGE